LPGFQWTGPDDFAGNNVDSIALEVPSDMFGAGPLIGVWATISRYRDDGALKQLDRGGNPTIAPIRRLRSRGEGAPAPTYRGQGPLHPVTRWGPGPPGSAGCSAVP
jgi:hypothetical protein